MLWTAVMIGAGFLMLVGLVGSVVALGGLDAAVLREAGKSLGYRLEYWQATLDLIAEHPALGVGPGNFKEAYTAHMLPQSSEAVTDPHNFLLEIAATTGLVGLTLFAAFLVSAFLRTIKWLGSVAAPETHGELARTPAPHEDAWPVYIGAASGIVLAGVLGRASGYDLDAAPLILGLLCGTLVVALSHSWTPGEPTSHNGPRSNCRLLSLSCAIAAATLLVNLLAAGGIGYLGVSLSLWLLVPLSFGFGKVETAPPTLARRLAVIALASAAGLLLACVLTAHLPVTASTRLLSQAQEAAARPGRHGEARRLYQLAAEADRFGWQPHMGLAMLAWEDAIFRSDQEALAQFDALAQQAASLNRRSGTLAERFGELWLGVFEKTKDPAHARQAAAWLGKAVERRPTSGSLRVKHAWALHRAGDYRAAASEAEVALQLDERMPHLEHQLKSLPNPAGEGDAEQLARRLRTTSGAGSPPRD